MPRLVTLPRFLLGTAIVIALGPVDPVRAQYVGIGVARPGGL